MRDICFYFTIFLLVPKDVIEASNQEAVNRCLQKNTCRECIAESPECAWCPQKGYPEERCNLVQELKYNCDGLVHPQGSVKLLLDKNLSNKGTKEEEAIQIKPQKLSLKIKPNSPTSFPVQFRQSVDYPVDLYYVMDLSNSMADDKLKLAQLGDKLAFEMETITTNFRLGFGSFVDKVAAPYVSVEPKRLKEPCPGCAAPYGFHNNMPLSLKTWEFAKKVRESEVSGNLDGVEGGFDAIMQAIVCKEEIGWRNKSRKLLVLSTDNGYHHAGDGKLAGIILPNDGKCHLDAAGFYTKTAEQDYPSLSQINKKLREHNVNIIFAVTRDQVNNYKRLDKRLTGTTVGRLEGDSSNVVKLIRDQYDKITSSVELTHTLPASSNIKISFESNCLGGPTQKTNVCHGLKLETTVTFNVTVEVSYCPKDKSKWNSTFQIYPVGLNEYLTVHLETICECDCKKPPLEDENVIKCNAVNGTYECGTCICPDHKEGEHCECDIRDNDYLTGDSGCYKGNDINLCSGNGVCTCGSCDCFELANPEKRFYGRFCECNDFNCDNSCNGPDHGFCKCGVCRCHSGWGGKDCSCKLGVEDCINYNGELCSGHGSCDCGRCICNVTEKAYFGKYCEDCLSCMEKCSEFRPCIECFFSNLPKGKSAENCSSCDGYKVSPVDEITTQETANEKLCTFADKQNCWYSFKYEMENNNRFLVYVKKTKDCPLPADAVAIISGVIGSVVGAGLLLLLMWKLLTTIHDRRELAKFEKERQKANWDVGENPIYKQATSTFENPVYGDD